MSLVFRYATIPAQDVEALAKFWAKATGRSARGAEGGAIIELGEAEDAPALFLAESTSGGRPPGPTGICLTTAHGTLAEETARLTALGAAVKRKLHRGWGLGEVTMTDPEGNEFLLESGPAEVAELETRMDVQDRNTASEFWSDAEFRSPRTTRGTTRVEIADQ